MKDLKTKILVLGIGGMLGHKVFEVLNRYNFDVYGTSREKERMRTIFTENKNILEADVSILDHTIEGIIKELKPNIVINCIGIIKQKKDIADPSEMIYLNALFPHLIATECSKINAKLITIGTDCVFDGQSKTPYKDSDIPTCHDAYGMTKYLGEINYNNHLTLRTSIIGHELSTNVSLLDWFLNVTDPIIKGYKNAIFSGFTTLEISKLLAEKIIPNENLSGLYQISVNPISKFELLKIIKNVYNKSLEIIPDESVSINRELDSSILREKIKYIPPQWLDLIKNMYNDFLSSPIYLNKRLNYEKLNSK